MSDLNRFLKVLNRMGYPNPNVIDLAKMSDYDLDELLTDLVDEVGEDKANEFTSNAISRISSKEGIKVTWDDSPEEYAYIKIDDSHISLENDSTTVLARWSWGNTNLLTTDEDGNESYQTIEEIGENIGMGEWSEYDDMVDNIKGECSNFIYDNCGFGIWWDDQSS